MARTCRTARKSTGRLPVDQLAPRHVPPPQETQPDTPQDASQEEEPFVIELVVPEGPMAPGSPAEEQHQLKDQDIEDEANEECPPPSDTEDEKSPSGPKLQSSPAGSSSPGAPGHHYHPRYRIKEVPRPGRVEFKAVTEILFGSRVLCRHKGPAFRTSHSDDVADAAW
jgi:hypothetical protein